MTHAGKAINENDLLGRAWVYLDERPQENGAIPASVFTAQHHFLTVYLTGDVSVRDGSSVGRRKFVVWRENVPQPATSLQGGVVSRFAYADQLTDVMRLPYLSPGKALSLRPELFVAFCDG